MYGRANLIEGRSKDAHYRNLQTGMLSCNVLPCLLEFLDSEP
jgi:hypothetical protein